MNFKIIQGGMGVGVSSWQLARAVSLAGQLGVVSGTGLPITLARRLELGDPDGSVRRALSHFPVQPLVERALARHFIPGGKPPDQPFRPTILPRIDSPPALLEMTVLANFVEVFLAKEGHTGVVGINYLEKMQIPTAPSILGAMLADVDYVLMGAGIPRQIPGLLDDLATPRPTQLRIDVTPPSPPTPTTPPSPSSLHPLPSSSIPATSSPPPAHTLHFDPAALLGRPIPLRRPAFLAIISSSVLATTLARKSNGRVDGFIIECPTAGGHNAPPRGPMQLNDRGEPVYGPRDDVDLAKIRDLGLPFYLAGGYADPDRLAQALAAGASGVQVGTAFAFCNESGLRPDLRAKILHQLKQGPVEIFTDPKASPTGYPFKVLRVEGTLSDPAALAARERTCNIGYLRQPYETPEGKVRYRCPAEPLDHYTAKGGHPADAQGRVCLCNALFATIGLPQLTSEGEEELPILTAGEDLQSLTRYLPHGADSYSAQDVLNHLLSPTQTTAPA